MNEPWLSGISHPAERAKSEANGAYFQVRPFQCSMRVRVPAPPTAQPPLAVAVTASSAPTTGAGCVTWLQALPFQCSMRIFEPVEPTAQKPPLRSGEPKKRAPNSLPVD
jgi:hypothetical protein